MPRLPRGKVQVCVYLDGEVAEALRKRVIAKYGKVRYLSREVEEAVRAWIEGEDLLEQAVDKIEQMLDRIVKIIERLEGLVDGGFAKELADKMVEELMRALGIGGRVA